MKKYTLAIILLTTNLFAQDIEYSLVDIASELETPTATDINNFGQVVGGTGSNAFFWENGNLTLIPGGAVAVAINDSGWVLCSTFSLGNFDTLFLWRNDSSINLNPFPLGAKITGGDEYFYFDINIQNKVIANFTFDDGDTYHAHVWEGGAWIALGTVSGFNSHIATKINDNDVISGYYYDSSENIGFPLIWQNKLPFPEEFEGWASSITNDLKLVGGFDRFDFTLGGWIFDNVMFDSIMTESIPVDINEEGTVLGFSHVYKNGNTSTIQSLLDTSGNGYVSFNLYSINDFDQIVGYANFNGNTRAVLLNPNTFEFEITSPQAGDLWIAGEKDTIRWISSEEDPIEIEISLDGGNNFESLVTSHPASSGEYVWTIPDTLLSRKSIIRITDELLPGISAESDTFKIKGYYLTRITPSGDYEKFVPNLHGWQISNKNKNDLWPQQWWQQFDYDGTDPFTNLQYSLDFWKIPDSTFTDWPIWVETFGVSNNYWTTDSNFININSVKKWKKFAHLWKGSCYGLTTTSLLAFHYKTELRAKHSSLPDFNNLFELTMNDSIRKIITEYFVHQNSQINYQNVKDNFDVKPRITLQKIKQMFLDDNPDVSVLSIKNLGQGGGGHSVIPYKIVNEGLGEYEIFVYDPNNPGDTDGFIIVDSASNQWLDAIDLNWMGDKGFFLKQPISSHLPRPLLQNFNKRKVATKQNSNIGAFPTFSTDYLMTSVTNDSIGYVNSKVVYNIDEGVPIIPDVGGPHPPIGYYIQPNEYSIFMNNFSDSIASLTIFGDVTYDYQRIDATPNQTDKFYYNGNFSVSSDDAESKDIELSTIIANENSEKTIILENTSLSQNDSLDLSTQDNDKLTIKNYGSEKNYDLRTNYATTLGGAFFLYENISLAENSSHQIVPVWNDLVNTPIKILIDDGIDGTVDDSIQISNQITDVNEHGNLYIPREFKLEQNYPNPFNPTTTIRYSIPSSSFVTLKVYDVLGKEVLTLVNEEQPIGIYKVDFDASDLSSGIYFYKIEAGNFIETKKMMLLK